MPSALLRGARIAYDDHGAGLPVLLVHGHPFDRSMWAPQVEALAGRFRFIVPDLRGYGESEVPDGPALHDEVALDLLHLLDALGVERVVVVGLSMGGQVAMEMARLAPHRLVGLVLCDTDARAETPESRTDRLAMADRLEREGMAGYAEDELARFLHARTLRDRPAVVAHMRRMMLGAPPLGAARLQRGRADRRDHTEALSRLAVPTLVVAGEGDVFMPVETARALAGAMLDATLAVIPETGHVPNLEDPEAFNEALATFLGSLAVPAHPGTPARLVSTETADHYVWGEACDGWHLVRSPSLSVIQERMPPGTSELRHRHLVSRQFFYVLGGALTVEVEGVSLALAPGQGAEVAPGLAHQVLNSGPGIAEFLVVSQPPSHGDRHPAPRTPSDGSA